MKPGCAALLLTGLSLLAACSEGGVEKKSEPPPVPVTTAQAVARDIPVTLKVVGRAEAYESVTLKARVDGQVAAILFTEGQHVKKDDVLIRLDPTDFSARLQQAAAAAARDEALLAKSRADTARYTALKERKFVSEEKVNDVRTNEAAAIANLRASRAAAEVSRLQLTYASIRAPFNGIVGARLVFPGSSVKINDTVLAVVNRIQPLLVSFSIPEKHLPRLREAMKSDSAKVDITVPGDTTRTYEGQIHFLDNAVDPTTGTILMKARLPNSDEKLSAGQFLNATLVLEVLKDAVAIPSEAVQQGADGNFTYVVKEDSRVEMRRIETAASSAGMTAVRKGLQVGETVVTDGQLRLAPGVKVKTKDPAAPPASDKPGADTPPATAAK